MSWEFDEITLEEFLKRFEENHHFGPGEFKTFLGIWYDGDIPVICSNKKMIEKVLEAQFARESRLFPIYDRTTKTLWFVRSGHVAVRAGLFLLHSDLNSNDLASASDTYIKNGLGWSMTSMSIGTTETLVLCSDKYQTTRDERALFQHFKRFDPFTA